MRILITGGCGFLGSHLVEHLLKHTDADIVILDKLTYASNGYDRLRDISRNLGYWSPQRVRVLGCDLESAVPDGVLRELGDIDYIIHAAAESHVDKSISDPLPFLMSNVIGTHHLLMLACMLTNGLGRRPRTPPPGHPGPRRIFVVSTDEVYGPAPRQRHGDFVTAATREIIEAGGQALNIAGQVVPGSLPEELREAYGPGFKMHARKFWELRNATLYSGYDEEARFRPANPYAASKAGAEAVAMAYANTYGLPISIVNTMNLIGERQHPEKFVPLVIRKVMRGETVTIHADPTREHAGTRFYLHCRTFANALAWLMERDVEHGNWMESTGAKPDIGSRLPLKIHVCGEREISNLELAQLIAGYVGKPLVHEMVDFHSSRPGHDLRYAMDDSLIRRMGWKRPMGLEQSLEKVVRWYLANPRWLGDEID